jgi:hypothetical protein
VTTIIKVLDAPFLDQWKVRVQVEGTARAAFRETPWENESEEEYVARLVALAKEQYEHERLANEAADLGQQVHALIEHAVRTELGEAISAPEATDEALFIFAGWKEWAKGVGLQPLMAEGRVYNPIGYCGTFDLLAVIEGKPAIFDWKPQARVYPERRLQSAAYREALHVAGWPELDGYIVAMPRDGGEITPVRLETGADMQVTFQAFLSCLHLYEWTRRVQREERKADAA